MKLAILFLSTWFIIQASWLTAAGAAQPRTTIEEFITGPGKDKSTLVVVCASGRRVEIILSNKFIQERNIDTIFNKLMAECEK